MYFHAKFRVHSLKNGQVMTILTLHFICTGHTGRTGHTYIRTLQQNLVANQTKWIWPIKFADFLGESECVVHPTIKVMNDTKNTYFHNFF